MNGQLGTMLTRIGACAAAVAIALFTSVVPARADYTTVTVSYEDNLRATQAKLMKARNEFNQVETFLAVLFVPPVETPQLDGKVAIYRMLGPQLGLDMVWQGEVENPLPSGMLVLSSPDGQDTLLVFKQSSESIQDSAYRTVRYNLLTRAATTPILFTMGDFYGAQVFWDAGKPLHMIDLALGPLGGPASDQPRIVLAQYVEVDGAAWSAGNARGAVRISAPKWMDFGSDAKPHWYADVDYRHPDLEHLGAAPNFVKPTSIALGDMNEDSRTDIIVARTDGAISIFRNMGYEESPLPAGATIEQKTALWADDWKEEVYGVFVGELGDAKASSIEQRLPKLIVDDLDLDGRPDIVMTTPEKDSTGRPAVRLLHNVTPPCGGCNAKPQFDIDLLPLPIPADPHLRVTAVASAPGHGAHKDILVTVGIPESSEDYLVVLSDYSDKLGLHYVPFAVKQLPGATSPKFFTTPGNRSAIFVGNDSEQFDAFHILVEDLQTAASPITTSPTLPSLTVFPTPERGTSTGTGETETGSGGANARSSGTPVARGDSAPQGFTAQPSYTGDCARRPAGSVCVEFPDGYIWLVNDSITGYEDRAAVDGHRLRVAVGTRAEYHHLLGTTFVKTQPRR